MERLIDDGRHQGLPPILDPRTRVLMLGSFPGQASLHAQQYYAHPRNQFWRLIGEVLCEPLPALSYAGRLAVLRRHRIGLWDVITRCRREGSLDSAIRDVEPSDFHRVRQAVRRLELVCFNGRTAARAAVDWQSAGYRTLVLPSSSPAYTIPFDRKVQAWRGIVDALERRTRA